MQIDNVFIVTTKERDTRTRGSVIEKVFLNPDDANTYKKALEQTHFYGEVTVEPHAVEGQRHASSHNGFR